MPSVLLLSIEHTIGENFVIRVSVYCGLLVRKYLLLLLLERWNRVWISLVMLLLRVLVRVLKSHLVEIHCQGVAAASIEDCRGRWRMVSMMTKMDTILRIGAC